MGKIISVVSGKGGVGKSTVAAGLGRVLSAKGCRVLLVDTDIGLSSVEFLLDNASGAVYHAGDVATGKVPLENAVLLGGNMPDFLPASDVPLQPEAVQTLAQVIWQASSLYDFVLVDRPAGLLFDLEAFWPSYNVLVVSYPDLMSVQGAGNAFRLLAAVGNCNAYTVLNRFVPAVVKKQVWPDIDTLCDRIGAPLLGVVPQDDAVTFDLAYSRFNPKAPYGKALDRIARRLLGESVPLPKLRKIFH